MLGEDAIRDEAPVLVEQKEVVVVARPAEGVVPLQDTGESAASRHDDRLGVVAGAAGEVVQRRVRPGDEVLLEVLLGLVAGRRVIRDAALDGAPHRLGHGAVLEVRLAEEAEVVDDHVGARREEAVDRLDHLEAVGRPGEEQLRARRDVVHDLEQSGTFVAAAAPAAAVGDRHVGQVAALLRVAQVVDAVGDDANDYSAAVEALGAHEVGPRRRVAFGRGAAGAHDGPVGRTHCMHPRERGDPVECGGIDAAADTAPSGLDTVHRHAGLLQRRQLLGAQR